MNRNAGRRRSTDREADRLDAPTKRRLSKIAHPHVLSPQTRLCAARNKAPVLIRRRTQLGAVPLDDPGAICLNKLREIVAAGEVLALGICDRALHPGGKVRYRSVPWAGSRLAMCAAAAFASRSACAFARAGSRHVLIATSAGMPSWQWRGWWVCRKRWQPQDGESQANQYRVW
jgi:hypothetical protein